MVALLETRDGRAGPQTGFDAPETRAVQPRDGQEAQKGSGHSWNHRPGPSHVEGFVRAVGQRWEWEPPRRGDAPIRGSASLVRRSVPEIAYARDMIRLLPWVVLATACVGPAGRPAAGPTSTTDGGYPPPGIPAGPATGAAPAAPSGPVRERAAGLREAADLLDKAQGALDGGNRNLAEMLFSSAELLTGPEAVSTLAAVFRAGAPPRVSTPIVKVADSAPQPVAVGGSEEDEPDPRPARGSLQGEVMIEGKSLAGFGVVTLEPVGRRWKPRAPKVRQIEQRNREFAPHVLAVPTGSRVTFPNFDGIFHNVFSTSEAARFDLGLYRKGEAREMTFEREGIVRLGCNLHANMSAYVVVVAAPHYAITDDKGRFSFRSLEPGTYKLRAWSEKSLAPVTQNVVVKAGSNQVKVGVAADAPAGPQPDKFGAPRGQRP
jgi:plastocyanin